MRINIKVPVLLREYSDKEDDLIEEIKFFTVKWDSEKGSLDGDKVAVNYLTWAIKDNIGKVEPFPMPDGPRSIKDPLKYPEDMAYALHSNGIPLPDELLEYNSNWCLSQQYYEHKDIDGIYY